MWTAMGMAPFSPDAPRAASPVAGEPTLDQHAVAQTAVADGQGVPLQQLEHRPRDAGAAEDDLGARRLEAGDLASLRRVARAIELDLAVDLRPFERGALDAFRVVRSEPEADRGEVGDG